MNEHNTLPVQPALFPLTDLQTKGYAKPATDDEQAEDDSPQPEQDAA